MIVRWKVEPFSDNIERVEFANRIGLECAVERQNLRLHPSEFFESEPQAIAFILERAERQVKIAQGELSSAKLTLRCLRRKYVPKEQKAGEAR